jgi:hypothetical protein
VRQAQFGGGGEGQRGRRWEGSKVCFVVMYSNNQFSYQKTNVNLVEWSKNIGTCQFPKDDKNVSLRRTPESIRAQPCRHCGSSFHWDNECKHSQKGEKMAQVNLIQLEDNDLQAQEDYDSLFYDLPIIHCGSAIEHQSDDTTT